MYVRTSGNPLTLFRRTGLLQLLILAVAFAMTTIDHEVLDEYFELPTFVVSILGTALAFFIGFINNQAYDRWWEARKIWGAFVNDSRNFGHMIEAYLAAPAGVSEAEVDTMKTRFVHRHIAFLYATVAMLRGLPDKDYEAYLTEDELDELRKHSHKPNGIALMQRRELDRCEKLEYLEGFRLIAINGMLNKFFDDIGQAERIKGTVFPLGHVYLTRVSLWLFLILLPMALADLLGYWAVLFTWILGMLYIFTFSVGQALVNPFSNGPSDTPMSTITRNIERNLLEVRGEENIPPPLPLVRGVIAM